MTDPVDLLVEGTHVDVTTGSLVERTIAIDDGVIVGFGEQPAIRRLQAAYVTPGLIDAHTHVEASMVTLPQYGAAVVPHGVTSVVHDPHEIANVLGASGVQHFTSDADETPLKPRMTVPSSVPATTLQDSGATVDADDVDDLLGLPRAVALGEVMDHHAILTDDADIHAKIATARDHGLTVDGHLPGISDDDSLRELTQHLDTDHESVTLEEARAKADAGFHLHLREGSTSKNLKALVELIDEVDTRGLSLCTDDRSVVDLFDHGGINEAVVEAISLGVDPVAAVQMATINTAEVYDLPFGRVEPGRPADLVLLSDLASWQVEHVIIDGIVDPTTNSTTPTDSAVATGTVNFAYVTPAALAIDHPSPGPVEVRVASAVGSFRTERQTATVPVEPVGQSTDTDGILGANREEDVLPIAVIERHHPSDTIGRGFVHNLGLERGAIGSTVAHDSHNCIVTGVTHGAMAKVANHLRKIGGGIAVYDPVGNEFTTLSLPIAGLLSADPIESTARSFEAVVEAATSIGLSVPGGLLELTYLALEVIPTYRVTNRGLVDVEAGAYIDVVVE